MGWSAFRKTGLTFDLPSQSVRGYTLFTPNGGGASYLIDMSGRIVHRWNLGDFTAFYARLLPSGNLLALTNPANAVRPQLAPGAIPTFEQGLRMHGGNATALQEFDWDGNIVWTYENPAIHHDFVRLANGNTLMPLSVELDPEFARGVRGGVREPGKQRPMHADDVLEIDAKGAEVRRHHLWQLLDPRRDPICVLEHRGEWTHLNGLAVTREGDIYFSCRENSRVGLIDGASGTLKRKFSLTNHQHNPSVLPNGNLQLFDNGHHIQGFNRSRIIEVNPESGSIVWEYTGTPPQQFYSSHISGAQRLPGDNVLICEGSGGRIFEVTRRGNVVWEFINPFTIMNRGQTSVSVFRAHRYLPDDPAIAGRDLDPGRYAALNRMYGLVD
jgi:hypothetical protein